MQKFSIRANSSGEEIYNFFTNKIYGYNLPDKNIEINYLNDSVIITNNNDYNIIREIIDTIAEYIMCKYDSFFIKKIVGSNYCGFTNDELIEVIDYTIDWINGHNNPYLKKSIKEMRKKLIIEKLEEFFKGNNSISINGFVTFRLDDYIHNLEQITNDVVDEYLLECEYNEFIQLMDEFAEIYKEKDIEISNEFVDKE